MEQELKSILDTAKEGVMNLHSLVDFEAFKSKLVGPKGALTLAAKGIGKLSAEERPQAGKVINEYKTQIEAILNTARERLENAALASELGEPCDPTLPAPSNSYGVKHPLTQTCDEITRIFKKLGFSIAKGPEVESEWYCFDALNTPDSHPARDEHDTLYLPENARFGNISKRGNERYILRSHTSTVQIRTLLNEKPPIRILSPGRAFRRDVVDATHSANFHQVEGLCIDQNITVKDLKSILDFFIQEFFGKNAQIRLRPSFFPFTSPSFELDFMSPDMGKLSNKWIELMGCGMVDPEVLKNMDLDPAEWSGFAFGMGLERLAMILYGIDDIRFFYENDVRFLRQFR